MFAKFSTLLVAAGFVIKHVDAQDQGIPFDIYSLDDCGTDKSKIFTEQHHTLDVIQTTPETENCETTLIDWGNWPQANGKYKAFIDTSNIEDNCQLIFYTGAPDDDNADPEPSRCFTQYRSLNDNSGCASVSIPRKFGAVYCCGESCVNPLPTIGMRDENRAKPPRDVTETKRAPILQRLHGETKLKRDSECTFDKTSDVTTQYLRPVKSSVVIDCPVDKQGDCDVTGSYSTESSISMSTTDSVTVEASAGFFGIGASFGYDSSITQETGSSMTFSKDYTLGIPPGETGYLIFTAKKLCGKGTFNGDNCDNALKVGEEEWCIPALVKNKGVTEPDGVWSVFQTN